jgi:hypothetical protein
MPLGVIYADLNNQDRRRLLFFPGSNLRGKRWVDWLCMRTAVSQKRNYCAKKSESDFKRDAWDPEIH